MGMGKMSVEMAEMGTKSCSSAKLLLYCVRWSMAGTEAVGLSDLRHRSLSSVKCEMAETSASLSSSCWGPDALSTMLCALMSPVS